MPSRQRTPTPAPLPTAHTPTPFDGSRVELGEGVGGMDAGTARLPCGEPLATSISKPGEVDPEIIEATRAWLARSCARCLARKGGACEFLPETLPTHRHLRIVG